MHGPDDTRRELEAGAADYIVKPFPPRHEPTDEGERHGQPSRRDGRGDRRLRRTGRRSGRSRDLFAQRRPRLVPDIPGRPQEQDDDEHHGDRAHHLHLPIARRPRKTNETSSITHTYLHALQVPFRYRWNSAWRRRSAGWREPDSGGAPCSTDAGGERDTAACGMATAGRSRNHITSMARRRCDWGAENEDTKEVVP